MTVNGVISSWEEAFDRCRRADRPMKFALHERVVRVFPSGRAEVWTRGKWIKETGKPEAAGSGDLLSDLFALLDECGVKMVFWVCPKGCRGRVVWNAAKTDATCQVCGCKKSDNCPPAETEALQ